MSDSAVQHSRKPTQMQCRLPSVMIPWVPCSDLSARVQGSGVHCTDTDQLQVVSQLSPGAAEDAACFALQLPSCPHMQSAGVLFRLLSHKTVAPSVPQYPFKRPHLKAQSSSDLDFGVLVFSPPRPILPQTTGMPQTSQPIQSSSPGQLPAGQQAVIPLGDKKEDYYAVSSIPVYSVSGLDASQRSAQPTAIDALVDEL